MIILKETGPITLKIKALKKNGNKIGFIPTMGALHEGHLSLVQESKNNGEITVCSIFVNPTQFNNSADFQHYPITIATDIDLLEQIGCDLLFLPDQKEIYPAGTKNLKHYELGFIETVYDGAYRPGHFQGVANVVERLFEIIQPDAAYFGLKDYQQCMLINKLVQIMGWQEKLKLHFCATKREKDGLAMSSRNMRLTAEERAIAPQIAKTLLWVQSNIKEGNPGPLLVEAINKLQACGFKTDYMDIAKADTLEPVFQWDGKEKIVILVATFLNEVRLIDNLVIN